MYVYLEDTEDLNFVIIITDLLIFVGSYCQTRKFISD